MTNDATNTTTESDRDLRTWSDTRLVSELRKVADRLDALGVEAIADSDGVVLIVVGQATAMNREASTRLGEVRP